MSNVSRLENREGFAQMLCDLFSYAKVTDKQVAIMLAVSEKTVKRWREGISQPSPSDLIKLFRLLNVPMLPFLIDGQRTQGAEAVHDYVDRIATESELKDMTFNLTFRHGSSVSSQLALVSMLNHMTLGFRLMIAKMVLNMWEIASENNGLQYTEEAMPDVEKVRTAVIKSHLALKEGRRSYTDI